MGGKSKSILNNGNHEILNDYEKRLNFGVNKIWQDVQTKLSLYFRSMNLEHFKFDEFLDILTTLNRYLKKKFFFLKSFSIKN